MLSPETRDLVEGIPVNPQVDQAVLAQINKLDQFARFEAIALCCSPIMSLNLEQLYISMRLAETSQILKALRVADMYIQPALYENILGEIGFGFNMNPTLGKDPIITFDHLDHPDMPAFHPETLKIKDYMDKADVYHIDGNPTAEDVQHLQEKEVYKVYMTGLYFASVKDGNEEIWDLHFLPSAEEKKDRLQEASIGLSQLESFMSMGRRPKMVIGLPAPRMLGFLKKFSENGRNLVLSSQSTRLLIPERNYVTAVLGSAFGHWLEEQYSPISSELSTEQIEDMIRANPDAGRRAFELDIDALFEIGRLMNSTLSS